MLAVGKFQRHKRGRGRIGIVRPEGFGHAPFVSAGALSVQGKADGVEYRGFSRAGIAGNEKDPVLAKPGKIDRRLPGIRPKGRQNQF